MNALNALIAQGGQNNIAQNYLGGMQMREAMEAREQQNALRALLAEQGGAIMKGDQNALAALAQYDPQMAMGIQGDLQQRQMQEREFGLRERQVNQSMAINAEQLELARMQGRQATERHIASMSAAEREAKFAEAKPKLDAATLAYQNGPEAWEAFNDGIEEFENIPFEKAPYTIAAMGGGIEAFQPASAGEPAAVQSLRIRAQEAGLQPGSPEYQSFMANAGVPSNMVVQTTPDGGVTIQQGAGVKPLTEAQSKDNVFATRATGALPDIDAYGAALTSRAQAATELDPTGLARELQTPEYQVAQNAGNEFLQAILRKDTGAAITAEEQREYGSVYLPRPGDTPEVLQRKQAARARAVAAIQSGMSPQQILSAEKAADAEVTPMGGGAVEDWMVNSDPTTWTPEQMDAAERAWGIK